MTRKLIYSSLLAIMLIGCGGGDSNSTDDNKNNNQEQQQEGTEGRVENNQSNEPNELSLKMENSDVSKKVDIKYLNEGNIQRLITLLNQNGYDSFSQKHVNTVYSDFDENGQEFYIITFDEDGYIVLHSNLNANAIYDLDDTKVYNSVSKTEGTINIDWMEIIADEVRIPFEKLRKSYYKVDRKLITKITWTSGGTETDFDLIVKSPNGQICNWQESERHKEAWGTVFLKDDRGTSYQKSFEAFSVDLDKMDEYASKKNLFGIDEGKYKFYVVRYAGDNIEYNFSFGVNGECSANNANDCPGGNWRKKASTEHQEYYSVYYKPKKVSTSSKLSDDELLAKFSPVMSFHSKDYLPTSIEPFINHAVLYRDTWGDDDIIKYGNSLPNIVGKWEGFSYVKTDISGQKMSLRNFPYDLNTYPNDAFYLDILNESYWNESGKDTNTFGDKDMKEVWYQTYKLMEDSNKMIYGRVLRKNGNIYLQYHFFYLINEWNDNGGNIIGYHEGDWEGMIVELNSNQSPLRVAVSSHIPIATYKGGETKKWTYANKVDTHPIVYIGKGGHPTYFSKGKTNVGLLGYQITGIDDHSGTSTILRNKSSTNVNSINKNAKKITYSINNIETDSYSKKWLTSKVYWGQDYDDATEKSVQTPKYFDPDRWSNPKKWMDARE